MEGEADREIERHPRQVEQGCRPVAREEAAHIVEVAQGLKTVVGEPRMERQANDGLMDPARDLMIEALADAKQHAGANDVEDGLEGVEPGGQDREADQRGEAAARKNAVVDLEHEQRPGQRQQIDRAADQRDCRDGRCQARDFQGVRPRRVLDRPHGA